MQTVFKEVDGNERAQEDRTRRGNGPKAEGDHLRALSAVEREWKDLIYKKLLQVMDLSLIGTLEPEVAHRTVRAFHKLLWIQNDLISRHYAGESPGAD